MSGTAEEGPKDRAPGACMGQFKGKRGRGSSGRTKDGARCLGQFKGERDMSRLPTTHTVIRSV